MAMKPSLFHVMEFLALKLMEPPYKFIFLVQNFFAVVTEQSMRAPGKGILGACVARSCIPTKVYLVLCGGGLEKEELHFSLRYLGLLRALKEYLELGGRRSWGI